MQATVLKPCSINGEPVKAGDTVEVDENTYNNLSRKEVLGPVTETQSEPPKKTRKSKE